MEHLTPALLMIGFATLVAVVGMPHGGLDHLFGRELFRPWFGRYWVFMFGLAYLSIGGIVVAGWFFGPAITIVLFFLISALHFGDDVSFTQPLRIIEGGMVIWVPLLFRSSEVAELLAWVVPSGDPELIRSGVTAVRPLLWVIAVFFVISLPFVNSIGSVARNVAFTLLFAFAPTLLSFVVYFCGWHSSRELIDLARRVEPLNPLRGLQRVMWVAAPMAGLSVVGTAATACWFAGGRELHPVVVQAVFLGLSALAIPHILLHAIARRALVDPFSKRSSVLCSTSYSESVIA